MQSRLALPLIVLALLISAIVWMMLPAPADPEIGAQNSVSPTASGLDDESDEKEIEWAQSENGTKAASIAEPVANSPSGEVRRIATDALSNPPLVFRIIDQDGHPVGGIPIAVGVQVPNTNRAIRLGEAFSEENSGLARITIDRDALTRMIGDLDDPEVMVDAMIFAHQKIRLSLPLSTCRNGAVDIRLPSFSWIDVEVRMSTGELTLLPVKVSLRWFQEGPNEKSPGKWKAKDLAMDGARARFACGYDMIIELETHCQDRSHNDDKIHVVGPTDNAPRIETQVLTLGPLRNHLQAKVLMPDGRPAANRTLAWYIHPELSLADWARLDFSPRSLAQEGWQQNLQCDENGIIHLSFPENPKMLSAGRPWIFLLQPTATSSPQDHPNHHGVTQISLGPPPPLAVGETWKPGDLQLEVFAVPILASGTVLTESGKAVFTNIWVRDVPPESNKNRMGQLIGTHKVNDDGSFELRNPAPKNGRVELIARASGFLESKQIIYAGAQNLEFVLRQGMHVRGNFLLDENLADHLITIEMDHNERRLSQSHSFIFKNVLPGSHLFQLRHRGQILWQRDQIKINGIGSVHPAELQNVDLRGNIRQWNVRAIDTDGKALAPGHGVFTQDSNGLPSVGQVDTYGVFIQLTSSKVQQILLDYAGFAPLHITWPLGPEPIILQKIDS